MSLCKKATFSGATTKGRISLADFSFRDNKQNCYSTPLRQTLFCIVFYIFWQARINSYKAKLVGQIVQ